jgi:hypothetical protein
MKGRMDNHKPSFSGAAGAYVTLAVTISLVVPGIISFCLIRLVAVP